MMQIPTSTVSLPCQLTLVGRSRAGDGTGFSIPELRWMIDCGIPMGVGWTPSHVFVTHTHNDHIQFLPAILNDTIRLPNHDKPTTSCSSSSLIHVYLPQPALPWMEDFLQAHARLVECPAMKQQESDDINATDGDHNESSAVVTTQPYQLHGLEPDQEITISQKGRTMIVRTMQCVHRIPCLGYNIFQEQRQLKSDYSTMTSDEIRQLKRAQPELMLTTSCLVPIVCVLGDTTAAVFNRLNIHDNELTRQQQKIIVVECSFVNESDIDRASITQHMHWKHLQQHVQAYPHVLFVLIHASLKYSSLYLRQFFLEQCQEYQLNNVHPLIRQEDVELEWRKQQQHQAKTNSKMNQIVQESTVPTCPCFICCPTI